MARNFLLRKVFTVNRLQKLYNTEFVHTIKAYSYLRIKLFC